MQQSKLLPQVAVDDVLLPKAEGKSVSGHPQHLVGDSFDSCTERYEIVVLLPNSEQYQISTARC